MHRPACMYFCVDFSFCCIIKQFVDSLGQNICCNKTSFHSANRWTSSSLREYLEFCAYVLGGSMCMLRQGCSLSMLHRTCEKCMEVLGWVERSAGSTQSQAGRNPSPSNGTLGTTVGDATSSPDNASGVAKEQGLRCGSTRQVPQLPPQPGSQHTQPRPSRGSSPIEGENNLDDPSHKWVINLSNTPMTLAQRSLLAKGPNYAIAPRHPPNLRVHHCHRVSVP